ncbi:MAG: family 20 glycosylhydrolase [Lentisphaeria bacterium]|nr:family 20 glycosylhydrolase [Lentisphaeria bacterium]
MKRRFLHLDFKGIVPRFDRLEEYLRYFRQCGFEGLVLEFDCRVLWRSWPCAAMPVYTPEEAARIVRLAESLGFETIPLMQIQGHLEWALGDDSCAGLRENGTLTLCPSAPGSEKQLLAWMDELRTIFPRSRYIHLGADEVARIGLCPACRARLERGETKFQLYSTHVKKFCAAAEKSGFRPLVWGDMLLAEPDPAEAAKTLPESTVIVDWKYWGKGPFGSTRKLRDSGREVWGASGLQCAWYEHFRQILPFYEDRLENILGWNEFDGTVIHTTWGRSGNKYAFYPPWLMSLPLFAAAGDPEKWERHPWRERIGELSRLLRRALEFELVKVPAKIRAWPASCRLEEESREYIALGVEYQIAANRLLEIVADHDAQLASSRFVGIDRETMLRDLVEAPRKLHRDVKELLPKLGAVFDRNGLVGKEEFLAEIGSQFRRLDTVKPLELP